MLLLDSNIIIYSVQPKYKELREWVIKQDFAASEISLLEVLGYHQLTAAKAIEYQMKLVTRNVADFDWIDSLEVLNPL